MSLAETIGDAFEAISGTIPEVAQTVAYSITRRENGAARILSFPLKAIATEGGADILTDAVAPSRFQPWTLRVLEKDWPEKTPPQIGDELTFPCRAYMGKFVVSNIEMHGEFGYFTLTVEPRDQGK